MSTSMIRDNSGNIKFTVRTMGVGVRSVFDKSGNLLGTVRNGNTYDKTGKLVAQGEDIGILTVGNRNV